MKCRVWLFGTGKYSDMTFENISQEECVGYIDNSENKIGKLKNGRPVISFDDYKRKHNKDEWIIIAVNSGIEMEIAEQIINAGIAEFIFYDELALLKELDYEKIYAKHNIRIMEYYRKKVDEQRERISFFMNHVTPEGIMPEVGYKRKKQLEMIKFAMWFCGMIEQEGIHPFLTCGNLLGKYRHDGFIPWDDDLDFGLFREEYEKLIDYCEKKYRIVRIDDGLSNSDDEVEKNLAWIDSQFKGKNSIFLIIYPTQLQLNCGSNVLDRVAIDFWCFDSYDDISFDKHKVLIDELKNIVRTENYGKQFELIEKLEISDKSYRNSNGKNVYFSLSNGLSVLRTNEQWINRDVIFPLKKVEYEGGEFFTPNKIEEYLHYEYKDFKSLPNDCGIEKHYYRNRYIRSNYVTVEFYLVDAFEIYHFEPLYHIMRNHGIYAIFVAECNENHTLGKWFDYENAIRILNERNLEYSENCNIDVDMVFTTQYTSVLRKYRDAIKINMTYGCSFNKNGFWFDVKALRGFDYKLVGGEFIRQKCLEKGILDEKHILIMGSPKHFGMQQTIKKNLLEQLNVSTEKKILCYFPTWDEDSSIIRFADDIERLREQFFIITKPHHCTFRLPEKREELKILYRISDIVLDGNYNFEDVANIGDVRLCDAKSGAALESLFVNPTIPTIFLSEHEDIRDYFYSEIYEMASAVIYDNRELVKEVTNVKLNCIGNMDKYFDSKKNEDTLWETIKNIIEENIDKKIKE